MMNRLFGQSDPVDQPQMASEGRIRQNFTGDDVHDQPHQGVAASSGVSARRSRERRVSSRRLRPNQCVTCKGDLEPNQGVRCKGCGRRTHGSCQMRLDIGNRFHAMMCLPCTEKTTQSLRNVASGDTRQARFEREDRWFQNESREFNGRNASYGI